MFFSQSIVDSILNNFLNETFAISNLQRIIMEIPRELPGLMVVFFSALLFFMCTRRIAAFANVLSAAGILLIAFFSINFPVMLIWLFIFSVGQHIFLPLNLSIGMELAREGQSGKRLGQLGSISAMSAVMGSFFVFIFFKYFNMSFSTSYVIAGIGYLIAACLIFKMKKDTNNDTLKNRLKIKREYFLYYWLTILFGTRKQIFLTFAPWVLVTIFHQKTQFIAMLLTIGGIAGIFFRPVLGKWIDKYGEKNILGLEAIILTFICLGYGLGKTLFGENIAFIIASVCYVIDQLLMAFGMARATYLKKIAIFPSDISNTLSMGTTIDHVFSIIIAITGAIIWTKFGYQYIFLLGALISIINFFSVQKIKTNPVLQI